MQNTNTVADTARVIQFSRVEKTKPESLDIFKVMTGHYPDDLKVVRFNHDTYRIDDQATGEQWILARIK